jgi:hypothetical protein
MFALSDLFSSRPGPSLPYKTGVIPIETKVFCQGIFFSLPGMSVLFIRALW